MRAAPCAFAALPLLLACTDYQVREAPPAPPKEPPAAAPHPFGEPPDWRSCKQGLMADFSNLSKDHPDVQDELPEGGWPVDTAVDSGVDSADTGAGLLLPEEQDWWDQVAYSAFESTLEHGPGWAPVDQGLEDDPRFFAVRWYGWLRVTERATVPFVLGGSTDVWVRVGDTEIAHLSGSGYDPQVYSAELRAGQYPFEILYAQRAGDELGFRFRFLEGELLLCPGEQ